MVQKSRGERLAKSANTNKVEPIHFLKADGTFSADPDIYARLSLTDRFLSNFHKPLQRRMFHTKASDPLPEDTYVFKQGITGNVYILGQEREDSDEDQSYERMSVAHLASNFSSARVEVFRYVLNQGDTALTRESVGEHFISIEFNSGRTKANTDEDVTDKMLFYAPATLYPHLNDICEFTLNGKVYSILTHHYDSGFTSGQVIDVPRNIQTYYIVDPDVGYDPTTGKADYFTGTHTPFSATLADLGGAFDFAYKYASSNQRVIYSKMTHGIIKVGDLILAPSGELFRVIQADDNVRSVDTKLTLTRMVSD